MRKHLFFLFNFLIMFNSAGFAKSNSMDISQERGALGVGLISSYQQTRLLNQDGTHSSYSGYLLGLALDLRVWSMGFADLVIFGESSSASANGMQNTGDKLTRNETIYGVKIYPNTNLFFAAAYGSASQKSTTSSGDLTMIHALTAVGLGYDIPLNDGIYISLQGWYKSGSISKFENTALNGNSAYDGVEAHINFIWAPTATIINMGRGK